MRTDGRAPDALRPVTFTTGFHATADGSVLYRAGGTVVLCTASVDDGVKDFLRGRGRGWVTAEYLMHPRAGKKRQNRDGYNGQPLSGRTQEIARLIGRALRAAIDPAAIGERTITIDCDVLEADGGTRTASITGGMVALALALAGMQRAGTLSKPPLRAWIAAVSAGVVNGETLLDLCYAEDRDAQMDCNVVADARGSIVEVQATAEEAPIARTVVDGVVDRALAGIASLVTAQRAALRDAGVEAASLGIAS